MKAAKRKQLQSNALATRMTGMVKSIREQSSRKTALYAILFIALIVGGFLGYRYWKNRQTAAAQRWVNFEAAQVAEIVKYHKETQPGIAARFQIAWQQLSYGGTHHLVGNPLGALKSLGEAQKLYEKLLKDVEGDPVYEPEAKYALAVIVESYAVFDRKMLRKAYTRYDQLAKQYPKSAFGVRAKQRAEKLQDIDSPEYQQIAQTYDELEKRVKRMGIIGNQK